MPDRVFTVHLDRAPFDKVQTVAASPEIAGKKVVAALAKDGWRPIVVKIKVSKRVVLPEEVRNGGSVG